MVHASALCKLYAGAKNCGSQFDGRKLTKAWLNCVLKQEAQKGHFTTSSAFQIIPFSAHHASGSHYLSTSS